jgi:ATP-dependent helicase/nuclease subunit B
MNKALSERLDYIKYFRTKTNEKIFVREGIDTESVKTDNDETKQKIFSVSDLEIYASCPFKYFVKKHIKPVEEKAEDFSLEAIEKGNIYHNILYRFYSQLQEKQIRGGNSEIYIEPKNAGIPVIASIQLESEYESSYIKLLKDIANDELKKIQYSHPFFELEAEEIVGSGNNPGIIEKWLKAELERYEHGWQFLPSLFELGFGLSHHHGKSSAIQAVKINDDFYLRGKIDRIELLFRDNKLFVLIADYKSKSGTIGSFTNSRINKSFQMPLYLIAAKKILEQYYNYQSEIAGAVYYILNPKDEKEKSGLFYLRNNDFYNLPVKGKKSEYIVITDELNNILEETSEICTSIIHSINNHEFPVEPVAGACRYCTYQSICRIDEKGWVENSEDSVSSEL